MEWKTITQRIKNKEDVSWKDYTDLKEELEVQQELLKESREILQRILCSGINLSDFEKDLIERMEIKLWKYI